MDQTFGVRWSGGAAAAVSRDATCSGDTAVALTFTLAAGTVTDQEQQVGFDVADVNGILITVTGNDNTTVAMETNATDHTGGQIFTFPAGGGCMFWTDESPLACPITTDVTTTYWTKTGSDTPTVNVRIILNS